MKKFYFFIATSLSLLLMLLLIACGGKNNNNAETSRGMLIDSARSIKIVQMDGKATVKDEKEELDCFKGMNLYDGDTLNIGEGAVLVIRFDEDKYVYLGENTKINIKSEGKDKYKTNIYVEKGIVLAEIQNKLGVDEEFFLSSNNSVMAVRGTVFGLEVKVVNNELIETYSVFKGVTELFAFDKINGELVKGKLTDISNKKIELKVNKDNVINEEEFNKITDNWLDDIKDKYEDEEDANSKMDEVQITVSTPSEDDYKKVIETISEETKVSYTPLTYRSEGYFDNYDGNSHKINVVVDNKDAKIYYRSEDMTSYQENNTFEYINPGSYRVYYKIVCDGYEDKEDFEVINIYKKNIEVSLKSNIVSDNIVSGMTVGYALKDVNLFDYIDVNGIAEKDKSALANSTFEYEGRLDVDTETYNVVLVLPDVLKTYYNNASFNIKLYSQKISFYNSHMGTPMTGDTKELLLSNSMSFNKYNGIKASDLFDESEYYFDYNQLIPTSVTYEYNHIIDGYIELKEGINTFTATLVFDGYDIVDEFSFTYNEHRSEGNIAIRGNGVANLGGNDYFYNTTGANGNSVNIGTLLDAFGITTEDTLINYEGNVIDDNAQAYGRSGTLTFTKNEFKTIKFINFPNSQYLLAEKEVRVYFSNETPSDYPQYMIRENNMVFKYNPEGITMNFVDTDENVVYSTDGVTYTSNLVLTDVGKYEVFYKVGNTVIIEGSANVTIANSTIKSSNLDMLSSQINIISNDGNILSYFYGEVGQTGTVTSTDGSTITPLNDVYEVYTNMIKNATYLDSITDTELTDVSVVVSEKNSDNANFTYTISKTGYETIEGSVEFVYSEFGSVESTNTTITNPVDLDLPYDSDGYNSSRIMTSFEEISNYHYECMYSIDGGKTWIDEEPEIITAGTYKVYCIYNLTYIGIISTEPVGKTGDSTLSPDGNYIISIQNITISE